MDIKRFEKARLARDKAFDENFVFGVKTTGIYCKPSCASRQALSENVCYFKNGEKAEAAGFRACLRCKPS